jgi:hypothetical protein
MGSETTIRNSFPGDVLESAVEGRDECFWDVGTDPRVNQSLPACLCTVYFTEAMIPVTALALQALLSKQDFESIAKLARSELDWLNSRDSKSTTALVFTGRVPSLASSSSPAVPLLI